MNAAARRSAGNSTRTLAGGSDTGFGRIVLTSIITAAVTAGLGLGGQVLHSKWADEREQRFKEVNAFTTEANKFEDLVAKYITELNAERVTADEREALQDNLGKQHSALEEAKTNLELAQTERATLYQDKIAALSDQLNQDLPQAKAKPTFQMIVEVRADNVCVVYDLRKAANLPVIRTDEARCEFPSLAPSH